MGAGQATLSHVKEQAIIKDQLSLNNSAMKSPASSRKNLRVSFTTSELDRPPINYSSVRRRTQDPQSNGVVASSSSQNSHFRSRKPLEYKDGDVTDSGISNCSDYYYTPTHLPSSCNNRSNNNHLPNTAYRLSQYDNNDVFVPPQASTSSERSLSSSRRSRARSVSPRRAEKIVVTTPPRRSDIENMKVAIRSARSASTSSRKGSDSSQRPRDRMTSFVIGRPAKFTHGAFGDMDIFKSISSVNENLYICGVMALSEEKIKALKIDCVVNATLEWPPFQIRGLETIRVQVDDVPSANLAPYFDRVTNKINEVICRGGRVLVHCMAGISRSSTLCIAYLMKYKGLSLQQAYSLMKTKRPLIRPNDGFWRQLMQYEKELKKQKAHKHAGSTGTANQRGTIRTAQHLKPPDDNPSMTVTGLASAHQSASKLPQKVSSTSANHAYRTSATVPRMDDRNTYASISALPTSTSISPLTRSTSNHKLGTLRNSGAAGSRLNPSRQREIAIAALRSGDHWSTTYANDYTKHFGARR